ncbi:hypothetical protein M3Y99_01262800 [Aphelenchoides fujianensis]|nr:hypothetical protein M3Y99_01262800 [Aphelenchoides fujianensis]
MDCPPSSSAQPPAESAADVLREVQKLQINETCRTAAFVSLVCSVLFAFCGVDGFLLRPERWVELLPFTLMSAASLAAFCFVLLARRHKTPGLFVPYIVLQSVNSVLLLLYAGAAVWAWSRAVDWPFSVLITTVLLFPPLAITLLYTVRPRARVQAVDAEDRPAGSAAF